MSQLDDLVRGFRAEIMSAINHHRLQEHGRLYHPRPGGEVSPFLDSIASTRERFIGKLSTMRNLKQAPADEIEAAEKTINELADAEIERAKSTGKIEFAD
jgi:HAMP domain-containing protein